MLDDTLVVWTGEFGCSGNESSDLVPAYAK